MNAQRTSAEETERTLRAESVLSDDRLPVKWDGEYIYWADTWTDTMPFLCGKQQPVKGSGMPRHGRTQTMETIQAPPVEAEDHQRPHHPKQTKTDAVRSLRTDPCGGTSTQRRKGNGLAVGRIRLWAGRQPPRHPRRTRHLKKQSRLIPAERTEMIGMTRPKAKDRPRGKPFDEPERKYLCSLDIIDACTEKRITWNKT